MLIAVTSEAKRLQGFDAEMVRMCSAIRTQFQRHAAPAWDRHSPAILWFREARDIPQGANRIVLLDDADQADALGYHDDLPDGTVYGRVFVAPVLDNGGTVTSGENSVSAVLSHEALELWCVTPETRVLDATLNWRRAGDIRVGDELVGFDEFNRNQGRKRRYRKAEVEEARVIRRPCYELILEDGSILTTSADHRWLVNNGGRSHWVATSALIPLMPSPDARGRVRSAGKNASRIVKPLDVWEAPEYADGYIAAALDGEGCLTQHVSKAGNTQLRLQFSQNVNPMLAAVKDHLVSRGIRWTQTAASIGHGRIGKKEHMVLYISNKRDVVSLLGRSRPPRLLEKFKLDSLGGMLADPKNAPRVLEKRFIGVREVVAMRTSTRTFIAEGFASHNCDPNCNLWADAGDGYNYAVELCDAVEADSYDIRVHGVATSVSNFVFPEWFDPRPGQASRFDYMDRLKAPFTMSEGGYLIRERAGKVDQIFAGTLPAWKQQAKSHAAARSKRRGSRV